MDEKKGRRTMGTKISTGEYLEIEKHILTVMETVNACDAGAKAYYVGGCLCSHDTNDIDVVVLSNIDLAYNINWLQAKGVVTEVKIYERYTGTYSPHFDRIITTIFNGRKVDFLWVRREKTIEWVLDKFPLSIQMRAMEVGSQQLIYGSKFSSEPIKVYQDGSAHVKYRGYYPDATFVDVRPKDQRNVGTDPFC